MRFHLARLQFHKLLTYSMSDDEEEQSPPEFDLLGVEDIPAGRLRDVFEVLYSKRSPSVLNLDGMIPPGDKGCQILQSILYKLKKSVKTLSVRFCQLSEEASNHLIDWVGSNDSLETIYIMGNSIATNEKKRDMLDDKWRKNLMNHRLDNMGNTFIRIFIDPDAPAEDEDA